MKIYNRIKNNKFFPFLIILLFTFVSCDFIFRNGIIAGHDLTYHLSRIKSISDNIKVGDFKSLIHNNLNDYGYANGLFYSNLFLYIPAIICTMGVSVINCYKILVFLMTFFTGLSMYLCVKSFSKNKKAALLSAIVYMLCPYRICDVMVRASLGEALAFIFVPIIILGIYELIFNDYKKWYIFSFGFVGLINCHLISTVFMLLITLSIMFYYMVKLFKEPIRIKKIIISGIFGLLLGAFFIFPMLEQYMVSELIINTSKSLDNVYTIPFTGLFFGMTKFTTRFVPGGIGIIYIYMIICRLLTKSKNSKENKYVDLCLIFGLIILFSCSDIIPWAEFSKTFLKSIQFSWRLLLFSSAFFSFAFGTIISNYLETKKERNYILIPMFIFIISSCLLNQFLGSISIKKYYNLEKTKYIYKYEKFDFAAGEYMPIKTDWSLLNSDKRICKSNNKDINVSYKVEKNKYIINYSNNNSNDSYIDVPVLYYKGYSAKSKNYNQYLNLTQGYNTWTRVYIGNKQSDEIVLWYRSTKITRLSYLISFLTLVIFLLKKKIILFLIKIKNNKMIKKNNVYLLSIFLTIFFINFLFLIKGIYPFGSQTISNGDMGQAYLPAYYNLWDLLHNNTGLFYNFNIGNGSNIYDLGSIYGFFNPIDWLIGFTRRNNIQFFINIIFTIKIALISLTSSIFFKKVFKNINNNVIVLFSVLYALSGYIIIYHTNFPWLANVALFPLLLLGLKKIFDGENCLLYIICLSLSLIFSFYISYMELLFILFTSGAALIIFKTKKERKKIIFKLGISTLISLGICSFAVLPVVYQTMHSYRFNVAGKAQSNEFNINNFLNKLMVLCFYGFPYIFVFKYLINLKKYKKEALFLIIILFLTTITILVEPINLLWHTGSYLDFPFRYGFIPTLIVYLIALSAINKNIKFNTYKSKGTNMFSILVIIGLTLIYFYIMYYKYLIVLVNPALGILNEPAKWFIISFIISIVVYYLLIKININNKIKKSLIIIFIIMQILLNSYAYIGIPREKLLREYNDESSFIANELYNYAKNDNTIYKYKDSDNMMFENYPFISKKSSLSTWHMIEENQRNIHSTLGYATYGSKLLDRGGTIFSDQILGINRIITKNNLDDNYKLLNKNDYFNIYEYNNNLPYGILYKKNKETVMNYKNKKYKNMNNIYKNLFNKDDVLFEKVNYNYTTNNDYDTYKIRINKKSYLYFDGTDINGSFSEIKVNGVIYNLPFINNQNGTNYNNTTGIINIGIFENEDVEIIMHKNDNTSYSAEFFSLPYEKIMNLINNYKQEDLNISFEKNKVLIKTHLNEKKSLFLPINYSNGLFATNNSNKVNVNKDFGNFVSIDLEKGENNIELSFIPPLLKISIIISLVSVVSLFVFVNNKKENKILFTIFYYIYFLILIIIFIYIYLSSFIWFL